MPVVKFEVVKNTLVVNEPFSFDATNREADDFLNQVDALMGSSLAAVQIDLQRAGNLNSTAIALSIAAIRKAQEKNKKLTLRMSKRNATAVTIAGLAKLVDLQLV